MQAPKGGPASFPKTRLGLPEDDHTFAPPPMSAYSIAVFSSNKFTENPGQNRAKTPERVEIDGTAEKYGWNPAQNVALRDSLKRKLSVRFNRSLISPQPLLTMSKSPKSPVAMPLNLGSSNGATTATSVASVGFGDNMEGSFSHTLSNPSSAILTSSHSHHSSGFLEGNKSLEGAENRIMLTAIRSNNLIMKENADFQILPDLLSPQIVPTNDPVINHKPEVQTDTNTSGLPSLNDPILDSYLPLRPGSVGSTARRSRVSRRFRSLGPPKRASEIVLVLALVASTEERADLHDAGSISQPPIEHITSPENLGKDDSFSKKTVSTDSDFFKSLKRLKEASPNKKGGFRFNYIRRPESPLLRDEQRPIQDLQKRIHLHELVQPKDRQPLRDVSPGLVNVIRAPDGFKKPKIPRLQVQEKADLPKDPTPQVPAAAIPVKHLAASPRASNSRIDEDKRKKIICVNSREYEKLEILGRGGSSKVYKVRSLADKKPYALKKVSFDQFDESCVRGFKGEIDLLIRLKNEVRVVSLIDHASSAGSLYLLMECGDLDLAHVLQNKLTADSTLDPNFVRFHASEVFHCIQAVHNAGIVHSDLKPANFLFVGGILKIIDFGIANAVPDHTVNIYRHSQIGTPNYMAPEALVEVNNTLSFPSKQSSTTWRVGRPSDIWSCGCIIYQMIYGRPPYASYSGQQRIMAIMNPQVKVQYERTGLGGVVVPLSAIELMQKCLERNPNDRWTVEECLDSDFLKPKAVNGKFVKELLHNAISLGQRSPDFAHVDDKTYEGLVATILAQIQELNIA